MRSNYKKLGDYISIVNQRNSELTVQTLLGVSIKKVLMPSIANTIGTNMKTYKIIQTNQFAYGPVTSRNGDKISIALLKDHEEAIVSQAYTVFEVIDNNKLHPEYLMMWFSRPEFDRYARFKSHGSARETFDWDELCEVELPIPSIEKQRAIVQEYQTITKRIQLNEQLNQKLEETAQAIYKHWFVDFEFPDENGKPYKSSGGEMVYNEELDMEVPKEWEIIPFTNAVQLKGGGTPSTKEDLFWGEEIPFFTPKDIGKAYYSLITEKNITYKGLQNCSSKLYPKDTTFITVRGTVGNIALAGVSMAMNQSCYAILGNDNTGSYYIHQLSINVIKRLTREAMGAVFKALVTRDFEQQLIASPTQKLIHSYNATISTLYELIFNKTRQNLSLSKLLNLTLSLMVTP